MGGVADWALSGGEVEDVLVQDRVEARQRGRGLGGSLLDGCGKRKVEDDRLVGVVVVGSKDASYRVCGA